MLFCQMYRLLIALLIVGILMEYTEYNLLTDLMASEKILVHAANVVQVCENNKTD